MPTKTKPKAKSTKSLAKKSPAKKITSAKKKTTSKKAKSPKAGDAEVTIDRRRKAGRSESNKTEVVKPPQLERREKVQRRRQIDPTTCERDYSVDEVEFMNALDQYKRTSGRMFPTCSEVLEVLRGLSYVKLTPAEMAVVRPEVEETTEASDVPGFEEDEDLSEEFEHTAAGESLC